MNYSLQDFINSLSEGKGVKLLRGLLWVILMGVLLSLFYFTQYRGVSRAEGMEMCQLARNTAATGHFNTQVIRPLDLWALSNAGKRGDPGAPMPDIRHAPGFPWFVSRFMPAPSESASVLVTRRNVVRTERMVVPLLGAFLTAATAFLVMWMGAHLFDARISRVAFVLYAVSASVLQSTFSGTALPLCTFLTTACVACCLLVSPDVQNKGKQVLAWCGILLVGLLCAMAFLSAYSMAAILVPVALLAGSSSTRCRWGVMSLIAFVALAATVPWLIRNMNVSGHLLGTAPFAALYDTLLYPGHSVDRELAPLVHSSYLFPAVRLKFFSAVVALFDGSARGMGGGIVASCFWVSLFYRFDEDRINTLKWTTVLGLILMGCIAAFDLRLVEYLNVFLPCVVLLGLAFLAEFMERLLFVHDSIRGLLLWALVLLAGFPMLVLVFGGSVPASRYPPYHPPTAEFVATAMDNDECVASDIPWATAWYGNRRSVLLPGRVEDLKTLMDRGLQIGGLYLTQETSDQPYMSGLAAAHARDSSWLPILNLEMPEALPFVHGLSVPGGTRDQLFLTDRVRWDNLDALPIAEREERPEFSAETSASAEE